MLPVGVIGVQRGGHDDDQIPFAGVKLDVALADPVRMIAEGAVKQPEYPVFFSASVKGLRVRFSGFVRQDDRNGGIAHQVLALEIKLHQCHGILSFLKVDTFVFFAPGLPKLPPRIRSFCSASDISY